MGGARDSRLHQTNRRTDSEFKRAERRRRVADGKELGAKKLGCHRRETATGGASAYAAARDSDFYLMPRIAASEHMGDNGRAVTLMMG